MSHFKFIQDEINVRAAGGRPHRHWYVLFVTEIQKILEPREGFQFTPGAFPKHRFLFIGDSAYTLIGEFEIRKKYRTEILGAKSEYGREFFFVEGSAQAFHIL
jgi:hypothetical protein